MVIQANNAAAMFLEPKPRRLAAWLLVLVPPALCVAVMFLVELVPSGPAWVLVQVALLSVIPLGLAVSAAVLIAAYLSGRSRLLRAAVCFVELAGVLFVWTQAADLLMTGWR